MIDLDSEVIPIDLGTMRRTRASATTASAASDAQRAGTVVRFEGVHKHYGRVQALSGVDAEFRPGRIAAILGPNGAGKTTLMKILLGLVRPDEGRVRLGERVVSGDAEYRHQIGYMPQLPRFPGSMSGRELAALLTDLRDYRGEPDDELVEVFGLERDLDQPFRALSGGTRQKVNAALALRFRAPVLVLDEPTAGLDPVAARLLKDKVRGERDRGRTVLLTSHDLGQVESLADDIVFLLDGRVRFAGALDGLLDATRQNDLEAAVAHLLTYGRFEVVT